MSGELQLDEPAEGVARLTISNPAKRNALDHAILDGLARAVGEADGARCIVVTGADGMFSSGYDLGTSPTDPDNAVFTDNVERLVAHPFTSALQALDACDVPTLAVLTGPTIGGGLELALACDLRLASDNIKLGMPPAKLGLIYSHTGLRRFVNAIGEPRTRELFLLGRYIDATTAQAWGLVNWAVDVGELETNALELATQLAGNSPLSMAGNKRVLRELLHAEGALDPDVEREMLALRASSFRSQDLLEGVSAFAQKRTPSWKGR